MVYGKTMIRTYKFRLYPTKHQKGIFTQWLTTCRILYNNSLAERKNEWETKKISVTYNDQAAQLKEDKKTDLFLRRVHSQVLQDVLRRVDKTFKNFFRRVQKGEKPGYPRFKGKNRYGSFTYPQSGFSIDYEGKKLILSKIGNINIKLHRQIPSEGIIKTCTIKRDVDQWYVCFSVELPDLETKRKTEREITHAVGIDVGLKSLLALSNGETVENPRWFRNTEKKLTKEQRKLSKKQKGSKNRKKQRIKIARLHRKVRNQRSDLHHKLSNYLVKIYDVIVFENLNITGMVKNHHLAKSISDAGWRQLIRFTQYKAEEAGTWVELVDPNGTTQFCSDCGNVVPKKLSTRIHRCPYCGFKIDRDTNAAINILKRSYSGQGLPVEPVGHAPLGDG